MDHNWSDRHQLFARYTFDDADQQLPTDFPQFPRTFFSRNQFFTGEYRQTVSASTLNTFRSASAARASARMLNRTPRRPWRPSFPDATSSATSTSAASRASARNLPAMRLLQNVFGVEYGLVHSRGRHLIKAGALAERYQDNMVNPTFCNGIFTFANVRAFSAPPQRFLGLTPDGALDRYWRFTLFGVYVQDTFRAHQRLSLNAGLRYEAATMPVDI